MYTTVVTSKEWAGFENGKAQERVSAATVEISKDRQTIRIYGQRIALDYSKGWTVDTVETAVFDFDWTFKVGDVVATRSLDPTERGGANGPITKITKSKVLVAGEYDRNVHMKLDEFIDYNWRVRTLDVSTTPWTQAQAKRVA